MAERRPLVLVSGRLKELPVGDTVTGAIGGVGGANSSSEDFPPSDVVISATQQQLIFGDLHITASYEIQGRLVFI